MAGFFLMAVSALNMFIALLAKIEDEPKDKSWRSIKRWRNRKNQKEDIPLRPLGLPMHARDAQRMPPTIRAEDSRAGFGFGRQGEKAAELKGAQLCLRRKYVC